jgi:hypothetical protein
MTKSIWTLGGNFEGVSISVKLKGVKIIRHMCEETEIMMNKLFQEGNSV